MRGFILRVGFFFSLLVKVLRWVEEVPVVVSLGMDQVGLSTDQRDIRWLMVGYFYGLVAGVDDGLGCGYSSGFIH